MGTHDNIQGPLPDDQNQNGSSGQGSPYSNTGSGQQGQPGSSAGSNTGQAGQNTAGNSNTQSGNNAGQNSSSSGTNSSQGNSNTAGSQGTPATQPGAVGEATAGVNQNVSDTTAALSKAKNTISDLMDGKANIVDAAMAAKGAFDAVKGLSGKISESLMMPVMKALGAFKGQAILPAAKQMDPVMGIDVHMVTIPPSPAPIPMPHPYIGMLFNAKDFVSCAINTFKKDLLDTLPAPAPDDKSMMASVAKNKEAIAGIAMAAMNMSASVKFGDFIPRAVTGTPTKSIPHIPMGAGFFPAFHAAVEKNVGKAFLGSLFVVADGDPMVGSFHLNYDCWDIGIIDLFKSQRKGAIKSPPPATTKAELFVPSGTVMPIPLGRPVLVNSIPTPINPLSIVDKLFKAGLGKLGRNIGEALINAAKKTKAGKKAGCEFWTAVSAKIGTGQSHPVDVSGGYFYTESIDFKLPGPIPLKWKRTWYSFSKYNGPLGHGWHHCYDIAINVDYDANIAVVRMADGRPAVFELPIPDQSTFNRAEKLQLTLHANNFFYLTDQSGLQYKFTEKEYHNPYSQTETHLLQSISNNNGYSIRFKYNNDGLLENFIDSAGRQINLISDSNGHITEIQVPDPRFQGRSLYAIAKYCYSEDGLLINESDAFEQMLTYDYDADKLMRKEVWRNGCHWNFNYQIGKDNIAKCTEVWGSANLLHYKFDYTDPECTLVTNSLGNQRKFFHKNGVVTKFINEIGSVWEYGYNQFNELISTKDPLNNLTSFNYDEYGNIVNTIMPDGAFSQTEFGNSKFPFSPTRAIDESGGIWQWEYDTAGNLNKAKNPFGAQTTFEYDDGLLCKIIDCNKAITQYHYDKHQNILKHISPRGVESNFAYDVLGNRTSITTSDSHKLKFDFDIKNRLIDIIDTNNANISFEYDSLDNVTLFKRNEKEIRFTYSFFGKLLSRTENGLTKLMNYDTENQLVSLVNEEGQKYVYSRDAAGNVIAETGFDGITKHKQYNAAGWQTNILRPGGKQATYSFDACGRVVEASYNDGYFEKYSYRNGVMTRAVNNNSITEFERDVMGNLVKMRIGEIEISNQYNNLGRRTKLTSSLGAEVSFDADEFDKTNCIRTDNWKMWVNFDNRGFEIDREYDNGIISQISRDSLGRIKKQIVKHQLNNQVTTRLSRQYSWNIDNQISQIADSNYQTTRFRYDLSGNLISSEYDDGSTHFRIPDSIGNLFEFSDKKDRKYDRGGRLISSKSSQYTYDEAGQLIEKRSADGIWKYFWNGAGYLIRVTRPDNSEVHFKYDALGRRIEKRYKKTITKWAWDGNKPLHEWKEFDARTSTADEIITWVFNVNNFAPACKIKDGKYFSIISDHLGTPIQGYNSQGEIIWERRLDIYGKRHMLRGDEGFCNFLYQGQTFDPETGLAYNRFRYYSPEDGCFISQDPIGTYSGEWNFYRYVKDTNLYIDIFGLEDYPVGTIHPDWDGPVDYSHLEDHPSVGPYKDFTRSQKEKIYEANREANGGYLLSDQDGTVLTTPQKSEKGVTPSPYESQVDHVEARSNGGTNSSSNAQVLSREQNREKSDS